MNSNNYTYLGNNSVYRFNVPMHQPHNITVHFGNNSFISLCADGSITYDNISPDKASVEFLDALKRVYPDWQKKNT